MCTLSRYLLGLFLLGFFIVVPFLLIFQTAPAYAATDTDIKTILATLERGLIAQGRPIDPITKILVSGSASLTDELRAFFFKLEEDQLPVRDMKAFYDEAGKHYDLADKKLLHGLNAYNAGDHATAKTDLATAKFELNTMRDNLALGISKYPEVVRVSYTMFISDAAIASVTLAGSVISFLVPISDSVIHHAANPDGALSSEMQTIVVAEFLETVSLGASKYLVEDPVNKTVGHSLIWRSLGDAQKEEIKQEIMRRVAEDSNILADKTLIDPVKTYAENVINAALDSQEASTPQEQKNGGFFSSLLQAIVRPFKFVGSKIKSLFVNDTSTSKDGGGGKTESMQTPDTSDPYVSVSPAAGKAGTKFEQPGSGFTPSSGATLHFKKPDGIEYPTIEKETDSSGTYVHTWQSQSTSPLGIYEYWALDRATGKTSPHASFEVTSPGSQAPVKSASEPAKKTTSAAAPKPLPVTGSKSGGTVPGKVTALVVDQFGTPLNRVIFWLVDPYGRTVTYKRITNENGRLETDSNQAETTSPGKYTLHVEQYTDDGSRRSYEKVQKDIDLPSSGLWLDKIILKKWPRVIGVVVDASGQPIGRRTYKRTSESTGGYAPQAHITNSDGSDTEKFGCRGICIDPNPTTSRFETDPLPAGHYIMKVEIPNLVMATKEFDVTYDKKEISLGSITISGGVPFDNY